MVLFLFGFDAQTREKKEKNPEKTTDEKWSDLFVVKKKGVIKTNVYRGRFAIL